MTDPTTPPLKISPLVQALVENLHAHMDVTDLSDEDYDRMQERDERTAQLAINEACRPLVEALEAFEEPMRRYCDHSTWLKGDEDMLVAAAKHATEALATHRLAHGPSEEAR